MRPAATENMLQISTDIALILRGNRLFMDKELKLKLIKKDCSHDSFLFDLFYSGNMELIEVYFKEKNSIKSPSKSLYKLSEIIKYRNNGGICSYIYNVFIEEGQGQLRLF